LSRPSLTRRLLLTVFGVIVVFFAVTVFLLDVLFRNAAERSLREVLDAQMVALVAAADPDGPESVILTALVDTRFDTPGSGLYAEIRSASGETIWRSQSVTGTDVQFGPPLEGGERKFLFTEIADKGVRLAVASRGIVWDLRGEPMRFTFSVASSLDAYDAQVASFRQQLVGWFAALALLLVFTLMVVVRWLSRPMRKLVREIKEVEAGSRDQLSEVWPQELTAVTSNLNALLESERTRIRRYRDTLGNLAHSLKTPLAVMRQTLGTGDSPGKQTLNGEIDRMSGIIEHQMKRAAASGGVLLGQAPVDVAPVVAELRVALLKVYGNKDLLFETSIAPGAQFIGDRNDCTELLGNLLDNACKWAKSRVRIAASVDGWADSRRALGIVIEDDGPGIAAADRARVLQRGGRADEATPGHGLGLAMVHDAVALYGGAMHIDASELGGARFDLKLPGRERGAVPL
jgi:two-component system, OmpR family, sensor histidine kinase PhoQ